MIHSHPPPSVPEFRCTALRDILRQHPGTIRAAIAEAALQSGDVEAFFLDALHPSPRVPRIVKEIGSDASLGFHHRHRDEIDAIREEYEAETGCPLTVDGDEERFLSYFAFAQTAYRIARDDLGLE